MTPAILSKLKSLGEAMDDSLPKLFFTYDECIEMFWINPFDGDKERLFMMMWPGHPLEKTEQVERWFENYAKSFVAANEWSKILDALKLAVEALDNVGSGYVTCHECDGGEAKFDLAKEAIAEIARLMGCEK